MQWHRASLSGDHAKADHCNHSSADYCDYTGGEWTDLYALDPTDIPYLLAEIERLRAALELGYRSTEARNLLAAASDDWGTTPMLAEFHERAGEALWPEGGES